MIEVSEHARKRMEHKGLSLEEVEACASNGRLVAQQMVDGESRYAKTLQLKDKTITVVYTIRHGRTRVITCYPIRRKRWW